MQDWLAHRARVTPEREALVNASSGNAWDYGTLDETVAEMAGRLVSLGVEPGDHLGAVLGTSVQHVCLVHAAMRLGACLVPFSPEFTPPELGDRIDRADVDAVVCNGATEQTVIEASATLDQWISVFTIDEPQWTDVTPLSAVQATEFTPAEWGLDDVQLLLFTSGTTGSPKVVQLTMGNLLSSAVASGLRLGIDPDDRWLVPLSLHHMGGIAPVLRTTLYGTTAVLREEFDAGRTVDDIRAHDITGISLVPTMLRRMLSARGTLPDCLRFVLVGGAPCPVELVERCRDYSVPVCPTYGMTETASQVATARTREAYERPDTVGRPLFWTNVTVVDESGDPVPAGEPGELVVSGPTVTPGYYNDPVATAEAMGPYGLHTGDVGYCDESGRLYVLNRVDDRIISGGENIDPGEVLDAIREHEAVADAAVVGLPDEEWGQRVAALVVTQNGGLSAEALEDHLRERLASFKLPRTLGFTEELPRTVSGTVEREAVREYLIDTTAEAIESAEGEGNLVLVAEEDPVPADDDGGTDDAEPPKELPAGDEDGDTLDGDARDEYSDAPDGDDDARDGDGEAYGGDDDAPGAGSTGDNTARNGDHTADDTGDGGEPADESDEE